MTKVFPTSPLANTVANLPVATLPYEMQKSYRPTLDVYNNEFILGRLWVLGASAQKIIVRRWDHHCHVCHYSVNHSNVNYCTDVSIWHFKFPKVVQAHTLGEVGILVQFC